MHVFQKVEVMEFYLTAVILLSPGTVLVHFVFLSVLLCLPLVPHLKFWIKESGKIFTCSAGDGGGAFRSLEVRGTCLTG